MAVLGKMVPVKQHLRLLADLVSEDFGSITLNGNKIKREDTSLITNNDRSFFETDPLENLRYFLGMSGIMQNPLIAQFKTWHQCLH